MQGIENILVEKDKYRPDIDGLRAVAVGSVVTFHAFPGLLQGGFIGVDVFFVISGFLISRIIFEGLREGTFSLGTFYSRRARRIFPALLLVLIACLGSGYFLLLIDEFKQIGKHVAGGAGFVSNFVLRNEAGYFDSSADSKPLLHLWSLGVEEQFYLLWPLILILAWRLELNLFVITGGLALISFYLNLSGIQRDPVATFYEPHTRFWELLTGAILAWITSTQKINSSSQADLWPASLTAKSTSSILGAAALLVGFYVVNEEHKFPGVWAVLPVVGAVLIIQAGPNAWLNRTILSNRVFIWFGLISFPLYLWHWPLLSFLRIVDSEGPSRLERLGAVALAIVLSWLTVRFVERPIRTGNGGRAAVPILCILMAVVGIAGIASYLYGRPGADNIERDRFVSSFENTFPSWTYFLENNLTDEWRSECAFFDRRTYMAEGKLEGNAAESKPVEKISASCYERDSRYSRAVMIWGDSHAQVLSSGVVNNLPSNWQVLQVASAGCAPNPDESLLNPDRQCSQSNYFALQTIASAKPDVVVVAQANGHSVEGMKKINKKLKALGARRVLFVGPAPIWRAPLPRIFARHLWEAKPARTFVGLNRDVMATNDALSREIQAAGELEYVDLIGLLCNEQGCMTHFGPDVKTTITTWDTEHLTTTTSNFVANSLLIDRILGGEKRQ